jgi:signal transduction histidine kinase
VHDLTAQKAAAEHLAQLAAERMRAQAAEMTSQAKNEFLSRMSHELRTPLNAVLGFAQLMKAQGAAESASAAAYIDHILQAGQHLVALVDDVLDLQRSTAGRTPLSLRDVPLLDNVRKTVDFLLPLAAQRKVSFQIDLPEALRVRADEVRLRQVLLNLGSNAIKYNREGGTVSWRAERRPDARVRLTIEDTGEGIAPAAMQRLFQPFDRLGKERTDIPGTGLGLLIARNLMQEMGGELSVHSEVGVGTSVQLVLDAAHD